jgi:endoglucanase
MWPFLSGVGDEPAAVYTLDGTPVETEPSAVALVAVAAAGRAAGRDADGERALDAAEAKDARSPTYFGGALVALGRVLLETPLIIDCDF